jgi:hypothetical protein
LIGLVLRSLVTSKITDQESIYTVLHPNYDNIYKILTYAYDSTDCDFSFVLRNILYRGAEEANYLSFQFDDDDGDELRRARIYLEGIILDLPDMMDHQGNVLPHCRSTILGAVTLSRYLIAIERVQTASQLDYLEEQLEECPCSECQSELKVA